jgi:hypothetical protein
MKNQRGEPEEVFKPKRPKRDDTDPAFLQAETNVYIPVEVLSKVFFSYFMLYVLLLMCRWRM